VVATWHARWKEVGCNGERLLTEYQVKACGNVRAAVTIEIRATGNAPTPSGSLGEGWSSEEPAHVAEQHEQRSGADPAKNISCQASAHEAAGTLQRCNAANSAANGHVHIMALIT
jgi:hypothetical protein